ATLAWDCSGHITRVTDPLGNATTFTWNAGLLGRIIDPNNQRITLTYATLANRTQRLRSIERPGIGRFSILYDANSRAVALIDRRAARTTLLWDANGNRTRLLDPYSSRFTFAYNAAGQVRRATDPLNHSTTLLYDSLGTPLAQLDP